MAELVAARGGGRQRLHAETREHHAVIYSGEREMYSPSQHVMYWRPVITRSIVVGDYYYIGGKQVGHSLSRTCVRLRKKQGIPSSVQWCSIHVPILFGTKLHLDRFFTCVYLNFDSMEGLSDMVVTLLNGLNG